MRFRTTSLLALTATLTLAGCEAGGGDVALESDDQMASYFIGRDIGSSLRPTGDHLDMDAFRQGLEDALAERESRVDEAELQAAMQRVGEQIREEQTAAREVEAEENRREGQAYLEENAEKEGVVTTESGLQYEVLEEGSGEQPAADDRVTIHYRGTLVDGTEFDSSYERGEPATFSVGGVIPGFSEGLQLMRPGGRYRFVIPSELGYGAQGSGGAIGPDETLIFEVELLEIAE